MSDSSDTKPMLTKYKHHTYISIDGRFDLDPSWLLLEAWMLSYLWYPTWVCWRNLICPANALGLYPPWWVWWVIVLHYISVLNSKLLCFISFTAPLGTVIFILYIHLVCYQVVLQIMNISLSTSTFFLWLNLGRVSISHITWTRSVILYRMIHSEAIPHLNEL